MRHSLLRGRRVASLFCLAMGLGVMLGLWTNHADWLRLIPSSSVPVFNGGLLSALGAQLVWRTRDRLDGLTLVCSTATVLLAALILAQTLAGIDLGLDQPGLHATWAPDSLHPGRVSPNACLAFLAYGLAVLVRHSVLGAPWRGLVEAALVYGGLLIGISALAGYMLELEAMYQVMSFNKMSLATSMVLTVLGAALWQALPTPERSPRAALQENRIIATSVAVLSFLALLSGLTTFAVLQTGYKQNVLVQSRELARTHAAAFANSLEQELDASANVARQLALRRALDRLSDAPRDERALSDLADVGESLVPLGFSAIVIETADGKPVLEMGQMRLGRGEVRLPLARPGAQLFWDGGLALYTRTPVMHEGRWRGTLTTEIRLTVLTDLLQDMQGAGATTDVLLCGRVRDNAICMPSRFYGSNWHLPMQDHDKPTLPVAKALLGRSGAEAVVDPRGVQVQAGYAPLGTLDLGLVAKTDFSELYAPLRARLHLVAGLLIALVALGTWLLRSRVHPLVLQVVADQRRMRAIVTTSHEAFVAMDARGCISEWNAEAERTFGWRREEALGQPVHELIIPPALRQAHQAGMARYLAGGESKVLNQRLELTAVRKSGEEFPIEITISRTGDTGSHWFAAFLHDITERRQQQQRLADQERRLRDITDNVPAMIGYFDADENCLFANQRGLRANGIAAEDLPGHTMRTAFGEDIYRQHEPMVRQALAGHRGTVDGESRTRTGRPVYFQSQSVPDKDDHGRVRGFYLMTYDVTALKAAEQARAAGEQRLRTITDNLPVLISYVDREHRVRFGNGTFRSWLGIDPDMAVGRHLSEVVGQALYDERRSQLERAMAGERVEFEMSSQAMGVMRHLQTVYVPDVQPDGRVAGIYTLSSDVSTLKEVEQQLRQLARVDTLTGLANRLQFQERLPEAMARSRRAGRPLALMFLDVDRFKHVNDTLGHAAGDEVLREFALRLSRCVRQTDTVARLAGDEFVIVLEGVRGHDEPEMLARKILSAIADAFTVCGAPLSVSTSLGLALYEGQDTTADEMLAQADEALYLAKAAGRNAFRWPPGVRE